MTYEEFKNTLKENNLSIKKFSELAEVSYSTCNNWSKSERSVSDWVHSWLKLYEANQKLQKEVDRHIAFKQEFYEMMNGQTIVVK